MSKTINLSGKCGGTTLVDDDWYDYLNQWKWYKSKGYAVRISYKNGKKTKIFMHRIVNNTPEGFETDHINRNKLDNRACNLRTVTHSENMLNRNLRSDNKSGYVGVFWDKNEEVWHVFYKGKRFCRRLKFEEAIAVRQALEKGEEVVKPSRSINKNNKSGHTGINWHKGKWRAFYKNKHIYSSFILEAAVRARKEYIESLNCNI